MLKKVNALNTGASFGDVAIMGKQLCTRNATIFCQEHCFFAVLDKDNFQRIIGEHKERETMEKVNFLKGVALFASFSEEELKTMIYFLEVNNFKYRDPILKEGQKIDRIHIVKEGKVKVRVCPNPKLSKKQKLQATEKGNL